MAKRGRPLSITSQYRGIAEALRERITTGAWANGQVLPSVRALGLELGANRHTLWQALNVLKSENLVLSNGRGRLIVRYAIMGATSAGGVILELIGDNLFKRYHGYVRDMQTGIMLGAGALCAPLLVAHDHRLRTGIPETLLDFPVRGVISYLSQHRSMLERLAKIPRPVVLLDHPPVPQRLHCISVDNQQAIRMCVDRLVTGGHRQIAFLRLATVSMNDIDADGKALQRALEFFGRKAGVRRFRHAVYTLTPGHSERSPALAQLLDAQPRHTAVICANEELARSVILAAQARSMKVPAGLSVLALGAARSGDPGISGPRTDFEAMGRMAVEVIRDPSRAPLHQTAPLSWNEGRTCRKG